MVQVVVDLVGRAGSHRLQRLFFYLSPATQKHRQVGEASTVGLPWNHRESHRQVRQEPGGGDKGTNLPVEGVGMAAFPGRMHRVTYSVLFLSKVS